MEDKLPWLLLRKDYCKRTVSHQDMVGTVLEKTTKMEYRRSKFCAARNGGRDFAQTKEFFPVLCDRMTSIVHTLHNKAITNRSEKEPCETNEFHLASHSLIGHAFVSTVTTTRDTGTFKENVLPDNMAYLTLLDTT